MVEDDREVSKNMSMKRKKGRFGFDNSGQTFKATGVNTMKTKIIQREVEGG